MMNTWDTHGHGCILTTGRHCSWIATANMQLQSKRGSGDALNNPHYGSMVEVLAARKLGLISAAAFIALQFRVRTCRSLILHMYAS
jgi:hypothetical protein